MHSERESVSLRSPTSPSEESDDRDNEKCSRTHGKSDSCDCQKSQPARRKKPRNLSRSLKLDILETCLAFYFAADCPDSTGITPGTCDITCGGCSSRQIGAEEGSNAPGAPASTSTNPVGYLNGTPSFTSVDLTSGGFAHSLVQSRSWSGVNNTSLNGNGWVSTQVQHIQSNDGLERQSDRFTCRIWQRSHPVRCLSRQRQWLMVKSILLKANSCLRPSDNTLDSHGYPGYQIGFRRFAS